MRTVSSQVRYAICGLFDLAYNADLEPVQLRVIGERQQIPPRYLEQIFQRLRKAGLVAGKRGPGGGYTLARGTSEITLRDVVEAIEGRFDEVCGDGDGEGGADPNKPSPDFLWPTLAQRVGSLLGETTIEDLCQEAARRGVKRASAEFLTYQI